MAITSGGTLVSCCILLAQLMAHPDIYTLPFTLHLCYKLPGIVQRVTKSQKVHISSHDYKHFLPSTLTCPTVFQGGCRVAGIFAS